MNQPNSSTASSKPSEQAESFHMTDRMRTELRDCIKVRYNLHEELLLNAKIESVTRLERECKAIFAEASSRVQSRSSGSTGAGAGTPANSKTKEADKPTDPGPPTGPDDLIAAKIEGLAHEQGRPAVAQPTLRAIVGDDNLLSKVRSNWIHSPGSTDSEQQSQSTRSVSQQDSGFLSAQLPQQAVAAKEQPEPSQTFDELLATVTSPLGVRPADRRLFGYEAQCFDQSFASNTDKPQWVTVAERSYLYHPAEYAEHKRVFMRVKAQFLEARMALLPPVRAQLEPAIQFETFVSVRKNWKDTGLRQPVVGLASPGCTSASDTIQQSADSRLIKMAWQQFDVKAFGLKIYTLLKDSLQPDEIERLVPTAGSKAASAGRWEQFLQADVSSVLSVRNGDWLDTLTITFLVSRYADLLVYQRQREDAFDQQARPQEER